MYSINVAGQRQINIPVHFHTEVLSVIKLQPYCEQYGDPILSSSENGRRSFSCDFLIRLAQQVGSRCDIEGDQIYIDRVVKDPTTENTFYILSYSLSPRSGIHIECLSLDFSYKVVGYLSSHDREIPDGFSEDKYCFYDTERTELTSKVKETVNVWEGQEPPKPLPLPTPSLHLLNKNNLFNHAAVVEKRFGLSEGLIGTTYEKAMSDHQPINALSIVSIFNGLIKDMARVEREKREGHFPSYFSAIETSLQENTRLYDDHSRIISFFLEENKKNFAEKITGRFNELIELMEKVEYGNPHEWKRYVNQLLWSALFAAACDYQKDLWQVSSVAQRQEILVQVKVKFSSVLMQGRHAYLIQKPVNTDINILDFVEQYVNPVLIVCNTGLTSRALNAVRKRLEELQVEINEEVVALCSFSWRKELIFNPLVLAETSHAIIPSLKDQIIKILQPKEAFDPSHYSPLSLARLIFRDHEALTDLNALATEVVAFYRLRNIEIDILDEWLKIEELVKCRDDILNKIHEFNVTLFSNLDYIDDLIDHADSAALLKLKVLRNHVGAYVKEEITSIIGEQTKSTEELETLYAGMARSYEAFCKESKLMSSDALNKMMDFLPQFRGYIENSFVRLQDTMPRLIGFTRLMETVIAYLMDQKTLFDDSCLNKASIMARMRQQVDIIKSIDWVHDPWLEALFKTGNSNRFFVTSRSPKFNWLPEIVTTLREHLNESQKKITATSERIVENEPKDSLPQTMPVEVSADRKALRRSLSGDSLFSLNKLPVSPPLTMLRSGSEPSSTVREQTNPPELVQTKGPKLFSLEYTTKPRSKKKAAPREIVVSDLPIYGKPSLY